MNDQEYEQLLNKNLPPNASNRKRSTAITIADNWYVGAKQISPEKTISHHPKQVSTHYRKEHEVDLHDETAQTARDKLQSLFNQLQEQQLPTVALVITGKGRYINKGVHLKSAFVHLCKQTKQIVAYKTTPPNMGGAGAFLILWDCSK